MKNQRIPVKNNENRNSCTWLKFNWARSFRDLERTWSTSDGNTYPVYTKLVDEKTLSIELICALIGLELSLQIPQSYLVRVPTQTISTVTSETIAFALETVSYPSISSTIREDQFIKQKVSNLSNSITTFW